MMTNFVFSSLLIIAGLLSATAVAAQPAEGPDVVFATIDDVVISAADYQRIFRAAVRNRYYHGKVPQPELARFQREVGRDVVDQFLVHREALRQGMIADTEKIEAGIAKYDARYKDQPAWQGQRERELPAMQVQLERRDLLLQMEEKIKDLPQPNTADVRAYYRQHPGKFTEPERKQVSIILLGVPPSAGGAAWEEAAARAEALRAQLAEGADFGELARAHSQDFSAPNGGDLGVLHAGMLAKESELALDAIAVGQVTEPIALLEGIALFRLEGRTPASLQGFDDVRERAASLLLRERQDQAWDGYLRKLHSAAAIEVNESLYMPIADGVTTR